MEPAVATADGPLSPDKLARLADRRLLSPPGREPLPFVGGRASELRLEELAEHGGFRWLPLPPVVLEDSGWVDAIGRLARRHPELRFAVGLNNVSHLAVAGGLEPRSNVWFFVDVMLYAANDRTLCLLARMVPRLLFAYEWLEALRPLPPSKSRPVRTIRITRGFRPPLFLGLGCVVRHAMHGGRCPDDCPGDFDAALRQGRNRFRLVVRDCVTWLFPSDGLGGSPPAG